MTIPLLNTLPQFFHVLDLVMVNTVLQNSPHYTVDGVYILSVGWPQGGQNNFLTVFLVTLGDKLCITADLLPELLSDCIGQLMALTNCGCVLNLVLPLFYKLHIVDQVLCGKNVCVTELFKRKYVFVR